MLTFAINLRKKRELAGITQVQMAEILNVSTVTYNRYEGGTRTPTIDILLHVAKIFHCTTDELLGYSLDNDEYEQVKSELLSLGITISELDNGDIVLNFPNDLMKEVFNYAGPYTNGIIFSNNDPNLSSKAMLIRVYDFAMKSLDFNIKFEKLKLLSREFTNLQTAEYYIQVLLKNKYIDNKIRLKSKLKLTSEIFFKGYAYINNFLRGSVPRNQHVLMIDEPQSIDKQKNSPTQEDRA